MIPIVEGKDIGIDLLIEGQPVQQITMAKLLLLLDLQLLELSHVGINQLNIGVFSRSGFANSRRDEYALLLPDDEGRQQEQQDQCHPSTSLRHVD